MSSRVAVVLVAVIAACGTLTGCHPVNHSPTARTYRGAHYIGALFEGSDASGRSFCSATVVASKERNLILTAAHCLDKRSPTDIQFAPMFNNGRTPFGVWHVNAAYMDAGWQANADPAVDFAFLTLDSQIIDGRSVDIQDRTGAATISPAADTLAGKRVTVVGYPQGVHTRAVRCRNVVTTSVHENVRYPRFDCNGFFDGTSGGPWLLSGTERPRLVGIIGGWEQGGNSDATSYSPPFGDKLVALYHQATK